jgi:hypothetical protein
MKMLITVTLLLFCTMTLYAQNKPATPHAEEIAPNAIRIKASVVKAGKSEVVLKIDSVLQMGRSIVVTPEKGQDITVRMSKQLPVAEQEKIEVDLLEKLGPNENTPAYMLMAYKKRKE